ncbi:unnamed protein product [Prorocentrum cordatum]|uniref:RNase H type-1 domain-containing protein n=1 Tax=Prorocentrum cordatum TaxID=2364126 RepID=A0ABN9X2K7_9DINO|nr:unnamed protein product [Polarella glacialis]
MAAPGGRLLGAPRSASPAHRRTLALDMRRIAGLLRESPAPAALAADSSMNNSRCSTPHSAWEPADRNGVSLGSAGPSPVAASRLVGNNQAVAVLNEKLNQVVQRLQQQFEGDRRRLHQVERRLEASADDRARHGEQRERWAELQGKVDGLIEETQSLTRRVEGLDERLWARTSGSDGSKQRGRELEQQVQSLEQHVRLAAATSEEASKRQAAKLRRAEHAAEESVRRLARLEEEVRGGMAAVQRDRFLETRLSTLEQQQDQLDEVVQSLQAQIDEGMAGFAGLGGGGGEVEGEAGRQVDDVLRAVEKSHSELEKKVMKQVEEQAAFRVKVDHQLSRVNALADRLETAHEPALESLRAEMASQRCQDRQLADGDTATLRRQLQESTDGMEDALAEVREGLRELRDLPRHEGDGSALRGLWDRLADLEQRAASLEISGSPEEAVSVGAAAGGAADEAGGAGAAEAAAAAASELEEVRSRLDWLEEQGAARALERPEARHASEAQDKMCKVLERLSCLEQQAPRGEVVGRLQQQLQQLQDEVARRLAQDSGGSRSAAEAEARVGAVSQQVALLAARLSEVEGGLDFAREAVDASGISEAGGVRLPLRPGAPAGAAAASAEIQDRLCHVAEHLEAEQSELHDLRQRLETVERQLAEGKQEAPRAPGAGASVEAKLQEELEALCERLRGLEEGAELEGGLGALARRVLSLEEGAEPTAGLEALSEQLGALKGELAALSKRQGAQEEGAVPKSELEALSGRLSSLEGAGFPRDLSELRGEVSRLAGQVQGLQGTAASKEPSDELRSELDEVKGKLEQLEEALDSKVGSVRDETSEAKATAAELSGKVSEMQEDVKRLAAQPWKDALDEPKAKLEHLEEQLGALKGELAALSKRQGSLEEGAEPKAMLDALSGQLGALKGELAALSERQGVLEEGAGPKGELEALSRRLSSCLRQEGAEPTARLEALSEQLGALKGELAALSKRQGALEEGAGPKGELEALSGRLTSLEGAGASRDLGELRGEVSRLAGQVQELRHEVRGKLEQLEGEASGAKAAAAELAGRVSEVQEGVKKLAAQPCKEVLDGQQEALEGLRGRLSGLEAGGAPIGALRESLQGHAEEIEAVRGRLEAVEKQGLSELVEELRGAHGELKESVDSASVRVRGELEALCRRLDDLPAAAASLKVPESGVEGGAAQERRAAEAEAKLAARIQAVEEQLVSRPAPAGDAKATEEARADVQEKVSDLTLQLARELEELARHGEELRGAASSAAAAGRAATPRDEGDETLRPQDVGASTPRQAALDSLAAEVAEAGRRARAAEAALEGLRRELDQVRGASPKVGIGIGIGGGTDDLRGRMDLLDRQVGELRAQLRDAAAPPGRGGSRGRSPVGEEPLDFSLTGAEQGRGAEPLDFSLTAASEQVRAAPPGEEPLDFSLTGASEQVRGAAEPLDYSLTGASDRPAGLGEGPSLAAAEAPRTPSGSAAEGAASGGGARGPALASVLGSGYLIAVETQKAEHRSDLGCLLATLGLVPAQASYLHGKAIRLAPKECGYLASVIVDGQWSQRRKYLGGYASDDKCLLCGGVGTLLHRVELVEVECLLERVLWPAPRGIIKPPRPPGLSWLGQDVGGMLPSGDVYLDGSAYEGDFQQYTSVGWAAVVLQEDADAFRTGISGTLCEPFADINGGELAALIGTLRHAVPPVRAIVDSDFVFKVVLEHGPLLTTRWGYAWAHIWRELWRLVEDFGGIGPHGLTLKKVPAHVPRRRVTDDGVITARDWIGNCIADQAAKCAAERARIAPEDRQRLLSARELVEGVAMWVSAVGAAVGGDDTTHRAAKPNKAAPRAALQPATARLGCDLRGPLGARWCSRCRWLERASECPGSIVTSALDHNRRLRAQGALAHVIAKVEPQVEAQLQREMPLLACLVCGATSSARSSSFARACGEPGAKGKLVIGRLAKGFAPGAAGRVAVKIVQLGDHGSADDDAERVGGVLDQLAASAQSRLGESMVSQSGNEVSVGADYSVEDSTELEKCDYFEAVEPSSRRGSPAASPAGAGGAPGAGLGGRPGPAELEPAGLAPAAEAPRSAASTGAVVRHGPEAPQDTSKSPTSEAAGPPAGSAGSAAAGAAAAAADDYEDESFADDMSIPESIPSGGSGEGSGSDEA